MSSISKKRPDGRYRARYRDADGREHARHFVRKADAQRWLDEQTASLVRGDHVDRHRSKLLFSEWGEQWMSSRAHLKPKTVASYESLMSTQIMPVWGDVQLGRIEHAAVASWVAAMRAKGLSASRTRQAYHLFKSTLDAAVRDKRLASNPAAGVDLPRLRQTERRYLDHRQVADLADGCGPYSTLVLVLAYCGLRWGEATALRVRNVNVMRGRVEIVESVVEVNGRTVFGPPKTHQRRSVPVPLFLRDQLASKLAGKEQGDLVFTAPRGGVLRVGNFRRGSFDRAAAAIGVPGVVPHELRHTAASLAISSGASVKVVQAMLGHASATLTLDRYGHLFPDDLDAVAERMDAARSADFLRTNSGPVVVQLRPQVL